MGHFGWCPIVRPSVRKTTRKRPKLKRVADGHAVLVDQHAVTEVLPEAPGRERSRRTCDQLAMMVQPIRQG